MASRKMIMITASKRSCRLTAISTVSTTSTVSGSGISNRTGIPKEKVDCLVIGAGVVGIAVARELALRFPSKEVLVIDSARSFGTGSSSRNSEVIHAGIYYPLNSLKARFCVRGRELLYKYCREHEIPHKQIGKLIVATRTSENRELDALMLCGMRNGVQGLRLMEAHEARKLEPELRCTKALFSPLSGILDSHAFMISLMGDAENHGRTTFSYNTTAIGGYIEENQIHLHIADSRHLDDWYKNHTSPFHTDLILVPNFVVNSTGLCAPALAGRINGLDSGVIPTSYYARGCYFTLTNTATPPFNHLIYPVPEDGGLGIHVTLDLGGQVKFGPDVEWIDATDDVSTFLNKFNYSVCADRAKKFYPEIRKYYPALKDGCLVPGYTGIRAKLSSSKQKVGDFVVQGEDIHGVPGLVNLFGIESPGLTASMAIAENVASRLSKR